MQVSAGRVNLLGIIATLISIALVAGCNGKPDSPDNPASDAAEGKAQGERMPLLSFHEEGAAPGNAIAVVAQREGEILHVAASSYSDRAIYYARMNGTSVTVERLTPVQGDDYVEQLALGVIHDRAIIAFRVGLTRLDLLYQTAHGWKQGTLVGEGAGSTRSGVVAFPRMAVGTSEIAVGYGLTSPAGNTYEVARLTDLLSSADESMRYQAQSLPSSAPIVNGDIAIQGTEFIAAYPSGPLESSIARWTFGDAIQSKQVWANPLQDGLSRSSILALASAPGAPVATLRAEYPYVAAGPLYETPLLKIGWEPDWQWTETGISNIDFPDATYAGAQLLFTARTSAGSYSIYEWNNTRGAQEVLRGSCQLALVQNSTVREAVAFPRSNGGNYTALYIPSIEVSLNHDPCLPPIGAGEEPEETVETPQPLPGAFADALEARTRRARLRAASSASRVPTQTLALHIARTGFVKQTYTKLAQ